MGKKADFEINPHHPAQGLRSCMENQLSAVAKGTEERVRKDFEGKKFTVRIQGEQLSFLLLILVEKS